MNIILASKSGVRKKILETNNVKCELVPSNVDALSYTHLRAHETTEDRGLRDMLEKKK